MARLRKPSPTEPTIFIPPTTTRSTRTSPRKAIRAIQYSSSEDGENTVLIPKKSRRVLQHKDLSQNSQDAHVVSRSIIALDTFTPRKQRILRPVESNSHLLRRLSNDSLASPEKRERRVRSGTTDTDVGKRGGLMYAKSLAKSVVRKQASKAKIDVVGEVEARQATPRPTFKGQEIEEEKMIVEANEEAETSLWCGDEENATQEERSECLEKSSDEDDEPVMQARTRRHQIQARRVASDSDEDESEVSFKEVQIDFRQAVLELPERRQEEPPVLKKPEPLTSVRQPHRKGHSTISNWAQEIIDLTDSPEPPHSFVLPPLARVRTASLVSSRPTSSMSSAPLAILTYSPTPTKLRSPRKAPPVSRPSSPPLAPPSPTKLVSPSKKKPAIPKASYLDGRPSLDAFWDLNEVNNWNDKHSPSKPLVSPKKQKWREDIVKMMEGIALDDDNSDSESGYESPITSPRKPSQRSPTKKPISTISATPDVKALRAQRKAFADCKHALATSFLSSLDTIITSGLITSLSAPTGGIKLLWSKTLKTTAGRANWRREQVRLRTGPHPSDTRTEIRHHCSIELAEKVIDDEARLYNVLAHEYCHLTTFMISDVRDRPHGAEFKAWGKKVSEAFKHQGVDVTTKHSYAIEYKFVWECVACGYEFKRHSKSVDPKRHSCGKCKGKLAQTRPVPRGTGGGGKDEKGKGEYQVFVKENFGRVKKQLLDEGRDAQMGRVMEVVAREYKERKKGGKEGLGVEVKVVDLEAALGELKL